MANLYPIGPGQSYATIAGAIAQAIADADVGSIFACRWNGNHAEADIDVEGLDSAAGQPCIFRSGEGYSPTIDASAGTDCFTYNRLLNHSIWDGLTILAPNGCGIGLRAGYQHLATVVRNCDISAITAVRPNQGSCNVFDSVISGTVYGAVAVERCVIDGSIYPSTGGYIAGCVLKNNFSSRGQAFHNCVFYGAGAYALDPVAVANCIFYGCDVGISYSKDSAPLRNFHHNCFHGCAKIATICSVDYDDLAAWQAAVDNWEKSPGVDSIDSDPLLSDPDGGDFSLQSGSPCKWTGVGAGVRYGLGDTTFDWERPCMGAYGYSPAPAKSTDPGIANVLKGVEYEIEETPLTGTFDEAARNTDPGEENVLLDVAYKIQNADKTGTYEGGEAPSAPTLTVAVSGTTITATLDGDAGVTNYVYYKSTGAWASDSREGDGDIELTGFSVGDVVRLVAQSKDGDYFSPPSDVVDTYIPDNGDESDAADAFALAAADLQSQLGEPAVYTAPNGAMTEIAEAVWIESGGGNVGNITLDDAGRDHVRVAEVLVALADLAAVSGRGTVTRSKTGEVWAIVATQSDEGAHTITVRRSERLERSPRAHRR